MKDKLRCLGSGSTTLRKIAEMPKKKPNRRRIMNGIRKRRGY